MENDLKELNDEIRDFFKDGRAEIEKKKGSQETERFEIDREDMSKGGHATTGNEGDGDDGQTSSFEAEIQGDEEQGEGTKSEGAGSGINEQSGQGESNDGNLEGEGSGQRQGMSSGESDSQSEGESQQGESQDSGSESDDQQEGGQEGTDEDMNISDSIDEFEKQLEQAMNDISGEGQQQQEGQNGKDKGQMQNQEQEQQKDNGSKKKKRGRPTTEQSVKNALQQNQEAVKEAIESTVKQMEQQMKEELDKLNKRQEEAEKKQQEQVRQSEPHVIKLETKRGTLTLNDRHHERFPLLLEVAAMRQPSMLVGPAGSFKTSSAETAAEVLELDFYANSVGAQTSKSDILGFVTGSGEYVTTQFRQAFENGGVYLMDEIDSGNPNVLIVINSALSGHFCAFPDAMVKKHEDFVFIGTANTYGSGASRQYVGRNQLDAATLDRFLVIDWPYDEPFEIEIASGFRHGEAWTRTVHSVRQYVSQNEFRMVISPRASFQGAELLDRGVSVENVIDMKIIPTASSDQREVVKRHALTAWERNQKFIKA